MHPTTEAKFETIPTMSWMKHKIQEWITSRRDKFEEYMLKKHLMETPNRIRLKFDKYKIDDIVKEMGYIGLHLPLYHCELNPCELK
jgi:hypothetical protein